MIGSLGWGKEGSSCLSASPPPCLPSASCFLSQQLSETVRKAMGALALHFSRYLTWHDTVFELKKGFTGEHKHTCPLVTPQGTLICKGTPSDLSNPFPRPALWRRSLPLLVLEKEADILPSLRSLSQKAHPGRPSACPSPAL